MMMNNKNQSAGLYRSIAHIIRRWRQRITRRFSSHVAACPRCQRRLAQIHRVELALMLVKTQPQQSGLLAQANMKALGVLKHSLRYSPKSNALRTAETDLGRLEKMRPAFERLLNTAACVVVILMIKTGVSRSLLDYKEQGEAVIHRYYARNLDSQMFEELFPIDASATKSQG